MKNARSAENTKKTTKRAARRAANKMYAKYPIAVFQQYEDIPRIIQILEESVRLRGFLKGVPTNARSKLDKIITHSIVRLVVVKPQTFAEAESRLVAILNSLGDDRIELPLPARLMIQAATAYGLRT